ncbi:MAG: hypothetical protein GY730_02950 [bacterium]|nr:hypothetical protein [bacterium]
MCINTEMVTPHKQHALTYNKRATNSGLMLSITAIKYNAVDLKSLNNDTSAYLTSHFSFFKACIISNTNAREIGTGGCFEEGDSLLHTTITAFENSIINFDKLIVNQDLSIGNDMKIAVPWVYSYLQYFRIKEETSLPLSCQIKSADIINYIKNHNLIKTSNLFDFIHNSSLQKSCEKNKKVKLYNDILNILNPSYKTENNNSDEHKLILDSIAKLYNNILHSWNKLTENRNKVKNVKLRSIKNMTEFSKLFFTLNNKISIESILYFYPNVENILIQTDEYKPSGSNNELNTILSMNNIEKSGFNIIFVNSNGIVTAKTKVTAKQIAVKKTYL